MFGRHHSGRHPGFHGRGPFGFHHHIHDMGRGFADRFFGHGKLRLVILKLIADQPSHGYELIKAVEAACGGAYTPSPGVIYPTLTHLEELGYVTASDAGGGKKLYSIAPEGRAHLEENAAQVDALFGRMAEAAAASTAFSPSILRARKNLQMALKLKLVSGALASDQVAAIAEALDEAARKIERV